jgi:peroxiredoxin
MAQLRHDYQEFVNRDAVIVVVGPERPEAFKRYWEQEQMPFAGLPDPVTALPGYTASRCGGSSWGGCPRWS